ncbi:MAG: sel1 repeat family protein [Polyangiaceae bacterium]|nr:sel1 repeat family protein [Polyangiaceae bacterium]
MTVRRALALSALLPACQPAARPPVVDVAGDACDLVAIRAQRDEPWSRGDPSVCDTRCRAGDQRSCVAFGLLQFASRDMWGSTLAAWHFENACTAGVGVGCTLLGEYLARAGHHRGTRAEDYFARGCELGDAEGCQGVGLLLAAETSYYCKYCRTDTARPGDAPRAAALLLRACEAGLEPSCNALGTLTQTGRGVAQDEARAAQLYATACDGGFSEGCSNLGALLADGRGVARDERRAADLHAAACEHEVAAACARLADLTDAGRGVARDEARAVALRGAACQAGDGASCLRHADAVVGAAPARALWAYARACDRGQPRGCSSAGDAYAEGRFAEQNPSLAVVYFESACEGGEAASCAKCGAALEAGRGRAPDPLAAARAYARGCALGDPQACARAAPPPRSDER